MKKEVILQKKLSSLNKSSLPKGEVEIIWWLLAVLLFFPQQNEGKCEIWPCYEAFCLKNSSVEGCRFSAINVLFENVFSVIVFGLTIFVVSTWIKFCIVWREVEVLMVSFFAAFRVCFQQNHPFGSFEYRLYWQLFNEHN